MRNHNTVVGAVKAAEALGEGHGYWKQWLAEPLLSAHLRCETTGVPSPDEMRMRRDERSRANGLKPQDRILLNEDLECGGEVGTEFSLGYTAWPRKKGHHSRNGS
jgi:hypothetical protein